MRIFLYFATLSAALSPVPTLDAAAILAKVLPMRNSIWGITDAVVSANFYAAANKLPYYTTSYHASYYYGNWQGWMIYLLQTSKTQNEFLTSLNNVLSAIRQQLVTINLKDISSVVRTSYDNQLKTITWQSVFGTSPVFSINSAGIVGASSLVAVTVIAKPFSKVSEVNVLIETGKIPSATALVTATQLMPKLSGVKNKFWAVVDLVLKSYVTLPAYQDTTFTLAEKAAVYFVNWDSWVKYYLGQSTNAASLETNMTYLYKVIRDNILFYAKWLPANWLDWFTKSLDAISILAEIGNANLVKFASTGGVEGSATVKVQTAKPISAATEINTFLTTGQKPGTNPAPNLSSVATKDQTVVWTAGTDDSKPLQAGSYISNCKVANAVALTFDDGPSEYTPQLLDTLKAYQVKATFFVVGVNVESQYGSILTRITQEGHQVACHSYTHDQAWPNKFPNKTDNANWLIQEMQKSTQAIVNRINKKPKYFRPPYGNMNEQLVEYLKLNGMIAVHWNVDTNDWTPEVKANPALIVDAVKGINGKANVLMHEIHQTTVQTVPNVIAFLKANPNLKFVTVAECMGDIQAYL